MCWTSKQWNCTWYLWRSVNFLLLTYSTLHFSTNYVSLLVAYAPVTSVSVAELLTRMEHITVIFTDYNKVKQKKIVITWKDEFNVSFFKFEWIRLMNCDLNSCPLNIKFHSQHTSLPYAVLHESDLIIHNSIVMMFKFLWQNIDSCTGYLELLFVPLRVFHSYCNINIADEELPILSIYRFRQWRILLCVNVCFDTGTPFLKIFYFHLLTMTELLLDLHCDIRILRGVNIKRT
jgi:hypothetical protein